MFPASHEPLARRFERFARRECHVSRLYERLSLGIAQDHDVLGIAAQAQPGQPIPNLLLGAVHFLLLQGVVHPLAAYYPSLTPTPPPPVDPYPAFHAFCLEHREALLTLISCRLVQTNEVRRCGCLLPAFALIASRQPGRPLALVEIGASAGLNLLWDRYGYDYGEGGRFGDPGSPVQIACELRGSARPPLSHAFPTIATRVGIDLNPVDVRDPDAVLWLRALVWPDEVGRAEVLLKALGIAQQSPPRLIGGDATERLAEVLAAIPDDQRLCVFHTHTVNQFPPEARAHLSALLAEHGRARSLARLSVEWLGAEHPRLELTCFEAGTVTDHHLAYCGSHGEWLEWL